MGRTVRTSPLIGTRAWFGPRRLGWGLEPVSLEGWIVTAGVVAGGAWLKRTGKGSRLDTRVLPVGLVIVAILKGTSPGGPRARAAFRAARRTPG